MYRNYLLLPLLAVLLATCTKNDELVESPVTTPAATIDRDELDAFILNRLQEEDWFHWSMTDDQQLWSALAHSGYVAGIGYQPKGFTDLKDHIHEIDLKSDAWRSAREKLTALIVEETNRLLPGQNFTAADLISYVPERQLPVFDVRIMHPELVTLLRGLPEVRYVEPLDYQFREIGERSDSGCDVSPASNIPAADYTTISPSVKVPWNFNNMNIPAAWNVSQGAGITICLIDTGTSPNQPKVGSQFASGQSTGRTLSRTGTYVSSWWWWASPDGPNDQCGHGTQMAGLLAAPRGSGGSTVGVAYRSNLYAIRGTGDVVVNSSSEKNGVADALVLAGNRSDVRIISMSIGDVFWSDRVADGIYYAYNRGKLIFAAAGTSLTWTSWWGVIFPANMAETVAVTGVKDGAGLVKCNTCHSGSQVDFIAVMQRAADDSRTSLTLAMSGNQPASVGGSSAATATTAGIAALVWATNPGQTRAQVLQRMKNAASFYPGRNGEFGWGLVNAHYAVSNN